MTIYPLLTFLWSLFIVIAACTSDAYIFMFDQVVKFSFITDPTFSDLLITSDINPSNEFYLIQKTGHIISFGILYILHLLWMKRAGIAFISTCIFAAFSEVLQLYFNRNGRLFDVGIDIFGILLTFIICKFIVSNVLNTRIIHSK
ncbi:VanZ family protein [Paenisporosarcina sp. TG20]|uniref:VanZ family protein n=1 Tax=Paenisporosarcina sp. TG20 TaxID=1211706 RepID=UPI00036FEA6B|nr:VanZ family protein [Paenisporosarcina sp. TG20]